MRKLWSSGVFSDKIGIMQRAIAINSIRDTENPMNSGDLTPGHYVLRLEVRSRTGRDVAAVREVPLDISAAEPAPR